jgi:hypothetical protein
MSPNCKYQVILPELYLIDKGRNYLHDIIFTMGSLEDMYRSAVDMDGVRITESVLPAQGPAWAFDSDGNLVEVHPSARIAAATLAIILNNRERTYDS